MFGPKCQSCSMPLSQDIEGGGTEKDGSHSKDYCSHCYTEGGFIQPYLTFEQMSELCKGKLKEMHLPGFIANYLVKDLGKLKRWAK